jgi:NitT/TauT family transport system substrate-binding protein
MVTQPVFVSLQSLHSLPRETVLRGGAGVRTLASAGSGTEGVEISRRRFLEMTSATCGSFALLGVVGCGDDDTEAGGGGGSSADDTYTGQFAFAQMSAILSGAVGYYCKNQGIFKRHGLDLELIETEGGSTAVRVIQSNTNIGLVSTVGITTVASKGLGDMRIISGFLNKSTTNWVAPEGSAITADALKGKKIGSSAPDSITTYFADVLAEEHGLTVGEDVEVVFIGGAPDAWTAVKNGVVDLAWSAIPFSDVLVKDEGARVVVQNEELAPTFVDNVLIATQSFLDSDEDAVRRTLTAFNEGIEQMRADPEQAGAIWARAIQMPEPIATDVLRAHGESLSLRIDRDGIEAAAQAAVALGGADDVPDLDELIDDSYLPPQVV